MDYSESSTSIFFEGSTLIVSAGLVALELNNLNWSFDATIFCSGEEEWPWIYPSSGTSGWRYQSENKHEYFCDPFRANWSEIHYCNDDEACDYTFDNTEKILIYANHTRSLSILCTTNVPK
eukprot:467681_1